MDELYREISEKFNKFLIKISYGLEGFTYKGKNLGSAVLLINFIQANANCQMSEIRKFLNVTPSTATRRMDKLVELGLVERSIGKEDHRSISLTLTKEGKGFFEKYQKKRIQGVNKLSQKFDQNQIKAFLSVLDFLSEASTDFIKN